MGIVEDDVQGVETEIHEVQEKISVFQQRISYLENIPNNIPRSPEPMYSRPVIKSLTFDGQTSWTVFKSQSDVTRRQKPGERPQVLSADVERIMSLVYVECPQDVQDSLSAQYFVDAIRDEDTQHATRLMDAKDLKSALAYSMKCEAAKTVSKTSRNVRSIEIEDGTGKEKDEKFDCLLRTSEKLLNSHIAGKKNTPWRNPNVTSGNVTKRDTYRGSARQFLPTRKTNVWPSYGAKAAFSQ
ncbi:hypothetical protein AVEN_226060-1 [Araneus ventricosus]|uniref:Uncharacterized protein n=1 Tax=Araneus ventricosus TaxID=182803 RepID=A0A4Y2IJ69_ARAVE|nr:hypothetical protein AVEN_226060-1 [Araneus ventricosus]